MKRSLLIVLLLFGCGTTNDISSYQGNLFIQCVDIATGNPTCIKPETEGTAGPYYSASFIAQHPVAASTPTTLFFEVTNDTGENFSGTITCNVTYLDNYENPIIYSFLTSINLASATTNTYSFPLSYPDALHTHGQARIIIDANNIIRSYASLTFVIEP